MEWCVFFYSLSLLPLPPSSPVLFPFLSTFSARHDGLTPHTILLSRLRRSLRPPLHRTPGAPSLRATLLHFTTSILSTPAAAEEYLKWWEREMRDYDSDSDGEGAGRGKGVESRERGEMRKSWAEAVRKVERLLAVRSGTPFPALPGSTNLVLSLPFFPPPPLLPPRRPPLPLPSSPCCPPLPLTPAFITLPAPDPRSPHARFRLGRRTQAEEARPDFEGTVREGVGEALSGGRGGSMGRVGREGGGRGDGPEVVVT